jgi:PAS domain S-box-containing protein
MINQNGLIEMVNAEAERVFGYERQELLGQPIEILVPERFRRAHPGLRGSFFSGPVSRRWARDVTCTD